MPKVLRNILFITFVIIFFVASAATLTYAFGYTLSGYGGLRFERTGLLDIETKPSGARLFLNGEPKMNGFSLWGADDKPAATPIKLSHLSPADYQIRLELEGFRPWDKKLPIVAGQTTYIQNVRFFKDVLPQPLVILEQTKTLDSAVSPNGNYAAVLSDTSLKIYNLPSGSDVSAGEVNANAGDKLTWSEDSKYVYGAGIILQTRNQEPAIDLDKSRQTGVKQAVFDTDDSDRLLYQSAGQWNTFDIPNRSTDALMPVISNGFNRLSLLAKGGRYYALEQNRADSAWRLAVYDRDGVLDGAIKLTSVSAPQFINPENSWINIWDKNSRRLLLLDIKSVANEQYNLKSIEQVVEAKWSGNDKLLIAGDLDLRIWNRSDDKEILLTRLSEPIRYVAWHSDDNYIVFATDTGLNVLELDNRDSHLIVPLASFVGLQAVGLGSDGRSASFVAFIDSQIGLYSIELY